MHCFIVFIFLFISLPSCSSNDSAYKNLSIEEIAGRNTDQPIYRAKVPRYWIKKEFPKNESLEDTMKPICEFYIKDDQESIRISIHNFPSNKIEERIPPNAQVARWKSQFEKLDPLSITVIPQAFGGFAGLFFEGTGVLNGQEASMMGWSMQLSIEHYQNLCYAALPCTKHDLKQMRSDYTIKAVGTDRLVKKHKNEIVAFARSFELIHEIPTRS